MKCNISMRLEYRVPADEWSEVSHIWLPCGSPHRFSAAQPSTDLAVRSYGSRTVCAV